MEEFQYLAISTVQRCHEADPKIVVQSKCMLVVIGYLTIWDAKNNSSEMESHADRSQS